MKRGTWPGRAGILLMGVAALAGCGGNASGEDLTVAAEEESRGAHGGWLLEDGGVTLELAIYEGGVPPEFRAWLAGPDGPAAPRDVQLEVTLTRLGNVSEAFGFAPAGGYLRGDRVVSEPHSFDLTIRAVYRGREHRWQLESHEGRTRIEPQMAERFGLETEPAGPAAIVEEVAVFGRVVANPEATREVRARFPGVVRAVRPSLGSSVRRGEVLIEIESDQSLERYPLTAPIDGVVVARRVNAGEHTGDGSLLTILDPSTVWAEFALFPGERPRVQPGMPVLALSAAGEPLGEGRVDWIGLEAEADQSVRLVAVLANADGRMVPGMHLTGRIRIAEHPVPLAVRRSALQSFRDFTVVFARHGDDYEVRMLELGRQDAEHVEVLSGLEPGERYVTVNSYLVKADIEKSGAIHEH